MIGRVGFSAIVAVVAVVVASACAPPRDEGDASASASESESASASVDVRLDLASLTLIDDGPFLDDEGEAIVPCGAGGVLHEGERVEVRTEWCDPADLMMPLPVDVAAGTLAIIELSHDNLIADGGEVHLAVVVGDEVVWHSAQTLPRPAAYVHERIPLARDHTAGERVVVHVHNHGANAYMIHALRFTSSSG